MRNLKLQYCKQYEKILAKAKFLVLNPNESAEKEILYLGTTSKLFTYDEASKNVEELIEMPGIIGCDYLALENEICIATESGEVLLVNPETKQTREGCFCDVGIKQMEWSPDQEVIVFVTKVDNVVVMSCRFETISEQPLEDSYFGSGQFISVGWGKKETQFHGSEGKPALKNDADLDDMSEQMEDMSHDVELSWRADAAFFCVSYVNQKLGRSIKIFDKEGSLKYTSENMKGLQSYVSWRPCGTWIAIPQILSNKNTIALIEKNGLRHREIVLPFSLETEPVSSLKWSPDSDILCLETKNENNHSNSLYFYTISNYHWYLKQVLNFNLENPISVYRWDNRIGEDKTLHIFLTNGDYFVYRFYFNVDKNGAGVVVVIDGKRLLITDLSKSIVPPPMCSQEVIIENFANDCFFSPDKELVCYDASNCLHIFECSSNDKRILTKNSVLSINNLVSGPKNYKRFTTLPRTWSNMMWRERYLIATTSMESNYILFFSLSNKTYEIKYIKPLKGTPNSLCKGENPDGDIYLQFADGSIEQISSRSMSLPEYFVKSSYTNIQLPDGVVQMESFILKNRKNCLISLLRNQQLYIDSKRIADDVTSYCLTGNYLAFTTIHTLYFIRLSDQVIVSERKMERGSKLVAAVNNVRLIFQLPRGNLETIYPRVLALELIGELLEKKEYDMAMDILRKQRINLNIICDHHITTFLLNLNLFLNKIQNTNWLNLFISDLQNEDFTKTMYASNYQIDSRVYPIGFQIERKVSIICRKLCNIMEKNYEPRFFLPIITAYVKMNEVEKALKIIWERKQKAESNENVSNEAIDALKHLLYLVDVNELYNIALGTYDFGLVLFVAQKSNKDPREFLPFLNELKLLEPNYRKYKIDNYLKRYKKALYSIALCGEAKFDEALELIKQHKLFQEGLIHYKGQDMCYQKICNAFGDYLRINGKLDHASIMYERGNNITQALLCAKNSLDWKRALALAKSSKETNIQDVAMSMVSALEEHDMKYDAYLFLKMYGNDFLETLKCLLRAKYYSTAILEAKLNESEDLIASLIKPDIMEHCLVLQSNIKNDQELFMKYKERLIKRREYNKLAELYEERPEDDSEFDMLSEDTKSVNSSRYTSSSTCSTGKTFRSSKNRRKHERKIFSLKPGNPYEEIALIDALHNEVTKISNQQQHIHDICKVLIELQEDAIACSLQNHLKTYLTLIQNSLDEIWISDLMSYESILERLDNVQDSYRVQDLRRYSLLSPEKRFKPKLTILNWKYEM